MQVNLKSIHSYTNLWDLVSDVYAEKCQFVTRFLASVLCA